MICDVQIFLVILNFAVVTFSLYESSNMECTIIFAGCWDIRRFWCTITGCLPFPITGSTLYTVL